MKIEVDKKKILQLVLRRFQIMQKAKQKIDEIAYQSYKAYHMILDEKDKEAKEKWQATVLDPYVFIVCESILPNIYDAFFQSEKFVDIVGRTPTAIVKETKIETVLDYFLEKSEIRTKAIDIIRNAIKYPAAIIKIKYKYEIAKKIVLENGAKSVAEKVKYDGPDFELVPIWDFFIDPQATDIDNARDIIHRSIQDYDSFLKNAQKTNEVFEEEIYDIEEVKQLKNSSFIVEQEKNPIFDYGYMQMDTSGEYYKNIELLEYWGKYDVNDDGLDEDVIILIGNRERVLRISENPYLTIKKPFIRFNVIRKENEFWGHSIPDLLDNSWQELNFWKNLRIDISKYSVLPPMLVPVGEYDYNDIKIEPGKVIWYRGDPSKISFLNLPAEKLSPQIEIQDLKQDMQQTAGPTDPIMGSNVGRGVNTTARGISIMASSSMARINMMVQTLAESFKQLVRDYLELLQQYVEGEITISNQAKRNEFLHISVDDLIDEYEFSINFRDVKEISEIEKQQIIELIAILGKIPGMNINVLVPILLEYFPRVQGKIDINQLLPQPQMPMSEVGLGAQPESQVPETLLQGNPNIPNIKNPIKNISLQQLGELR